MMSCWRFLASTLGTCARPPHAVVTALVLALLLLLCPDKFSTNPAATGSSPRKQKIKWWSSLWSRITTSDWGATSSDPPAGSSALCALADRLSSFTLMCRIPRHLKAYTDRPPATPARPSTHLGVTIGAVVLSSFIAVFDREAATVSFMTSNCAGQRQNTNRQLLRGVEEEEASTLNGSHFPALPFGGCRLH
jgi:hypothetical protein